MRLPSNVYTPNQCFNYFNIIIADHNKSETRGEWWRFELRATCSVGRIKMIILVRIYSDDTVYTQIKYYNNVRLTHRKYITITIVFSYFELLFVSWHQNKASWGATLTSGFTVKSSWQVLRLIRQPFLNNIIFTAFC